MTRELSIASVTVAYNAAHLLPLQLDALLRQCRSLDEIIVVNNGSTDETLNLLSAKYPQVTVLNLPVNVGVGGGFSAGLAYAVTEKKHDWVWFLDDDSVPGGDGLESLLNGLNRIGAIENIGILAPLPTHSQTALAYPGMLWRNGWIRPSSEDLRQPICFVDAVISSGSLIRREAVEKVGLPRADFFMDFIDFEFCLRIRRHGYRIAMVCDSHLNHEIGNVKTVRMLGYSRAWADHAPWREYYMSRNETFTIWNDYSDWRSKVFVFRKLLRHAAGILLFGEHKRACLRMMLLGFLDGRAGRLGIRFVSSAQKESHASVSLYAVKSASE
jgi:rhamnosyltransferase